jgi:spermidine synthase
MSKYFEELDYCPTVIGALSLRRRFEPLVGHDVIELKLGDEFLMSSLFTASEVALANHALEAHKGDALQIALGGLGLGYTAKAALDHRKTTSLTVVEFLDPIIRWHREELLPLGAELFSDPRCRIIVGDFFALSDSVDGFDASNPGRQYDVILIDIDHSPSHHLSPGSASFYSQSGLERLRNHLNPGGILGLWSDDRPDDHFLGVLRASFSEAWPEPVTFDNPLLRVPYTQTVYLAKNHES